MGQVVADIFLMEVEFYPSLIEVCAELAQHFRIEVLQALRKPATYQNL